LEGFKISDADARVEQVSAYAQQVTIMKILPGRTNRMFCDASVMILSVRMDGFHRPGRKRHGIERLREALDNVAESRGLITRKLRHD